MCGKNLIGTNSDKYTVGMGDNTSVESLRVELNRGMGEVYIQPASKHHQLAEGTSLTQPFAIAHSGDLLLCP